MKITINPDSSVTETEVLIKCSRVDDEVLHAVAVLSVFEEKTPPQEALIGFAAGKRFIIDAARLIYIDTVDKRCFLYTDDGVFESSLKLYELEALLCVDTSLSGNFMRGGKSCLFNFNKIKSIESDLDRRLILTMENEMQVVVSRKYSSQVKQKLEKYNGR
jgi:DNA-binding LytR/AlgR family response regulator